MFHMFFFLPLPCIYNFKCNNVWFLYFYFISYLFFYLSSSLYRHLDRTCLFLCLLHLYMVSLDVEYIYGALDT